MNFAGSYEPVTSLLLTWTAKATVLLGLAWILSFALRRRSAALRHRVWAIAVVGSLALPLVALVIPAWHVLSAPPAATANISQALVVTNVAAPLPVPVAPARGLDTAALVGATLLVWVLGTILIAFKLLMGLARLWRISAYSKRAPENAQVALDKLRVLFGVRRKIRLLGAPSAAMMPMTWGIFRPRIVLPTDAAEWDDERRRIVLSHELAHVSRTDWLLQLCAEALRACFWFHPLAWIAANRLRQESERACDDAVLNSGIAAPEYAGQLLALARSLKTPNWRFSLALAIARPSKLERRFAAMLDSSISRNPLSRRNSLAGILLAAGLLFPLAALSLSAEAPRETREISSPTRSAAPVAEGPDASGGAIVTGRLTDRKGLPIQGANVTLAGGEVSDRVATGPSGEFLFSDLAPGIYTVHIEHRWFGIVESRSIEVHLASRASSAKINLALRGSASPRVSAAVRAGTDNSESTRAQNMASGPVGSISGVIGDPSGAVIPFAAVTLRDVATARQQQITANAAGQFTLSNLIPDNYELSVSQPGFQVYKQTIQLSPSEELKLPELLLTIGAVSQVVTIQASRLGPADVQTAPSGTVPVAACPATLRAAQPAYSNPTQKQPGPPPTPTRVRVGGNIEMARLVQQTMPIYPAAARAAGIQGTAVMRTIIGKDGTPLSTCVVSGPALLAQAALDAVSQWHYSPTLLNGEPVEVMTEIQVVFTLRD